MNRPLPLGPSAIATPRRGLWRTERRGVAARFGLLLAVLVAVAGCADASALLLPDWTLEAPSGLRTNVTLPVHLDGQLPRASCHYILRRHVDLPDSLRGRPLVLVLPRFLGLSSLRVDERLAQSLEEPEREGYRARGPHAWEVPVEATSDGALDLELGVDHRWTQSAWIDTVPRLTTAPDGGRTFVYQRTFNDVTSYAALSCALFAGYLYLLVFIADRRRANFGWFALTGLTGFAYPLFDTALAQRILGPAEVTIAAVGVTSAIIAQLHFTTTHFGLPRPSRAWDVGWVIVTGACLASTGYFTGTRVGGTLGVLSVLPTCVAQMLLFARLVRRRPLPLNLFTLLGGWLVMTFLGLPEFIAWTGHGELLGGWRTTSLDILLIALLQTAALSREHTLSLRKADELAMEREKRIGLLESHSREVEVLNDELRRQIVARSSQLADALSGLAGLPSQVTLSPGALVDDRYEVVRLLGAGAAGSVYLVERRVDRAKLAMKIVHGTNDPMGLARLAREAQLAAEVKHENVIAMVDVDVATGGFLYVVMEYVAGDSLREHRADYGRVPWALEVLRQLAAGLSAVHAHGIIHRDLKPANVLLVPRAGAWPLVKIADFGIAGLARAEHAATVRATDPDRGGSGAVRSDVHLTQTGVLLGTPLYMAPETIDGANRATPAVDVFSLGVMAFELLTRKPPFAESPALAQLQGLTVAPAPRLSSVCLALAPGIAAVLDRCLAFDPAERPSAEDVLAALTAASREGREGLGA